MNLRVGFERRKTNMGARAMAAAAGCGLREQSRAITNTNVMSPTASSNANNELYLEEQMRSEANFEGIVGQSSALRRVLQLVETVAPSDSTVLLVGETG